MIPILRQFARSSSSDWHINFAALLYLAAREFSQLSFIYDTELFSSLDFRTVGAGGATHPPPPQILTETEVKADLIYVLPIAPHKFSDLPTDLQFISRRVLTKENQDFFLM